jgi:hypothetical protein
VPFNTQIDDHIRSPFPVHQSRTPTSVSNTAIAFSVVPYTQSKHTKTVGKRRPTKSPFKLYINTSKSPSNVDFLNQTKYIFVDRFALSLFLSLLFCTLRLVQKRRRRRSEELLNSLKQIYLRIVAFVFSHEFLIKLDLFL